MLDERTPRRTFVPEDADAHKELNKHLTDSQLLEISEALEFVKSQTGHGQVVIQYVNGLPRYVKAEISKELKP